MTHDVTELEITRLGGQGDGIAETPAGLVFVAKSIPGDRVRAEIVGDRGRLIEIVRPSSGRAAPACRHFGTCGGCTAQHMGLATYLGWKREIVRAAFAQSGLTPQIGEVVAVPPASRRRAVLTAAKRVRGVELGFHEEGSHSLVPIDECPVLVPAIADVLPVLKDIAAAMIGSADAARLIVTATSNGLDIAVQGPAKLPNPKALAGLGELAADARVARLTLNGQIVLQRAVPLLMAGGASVPFPPGVFLQATVEAEAGIGAIIAAATVKAKRAVDLFCGVGTFTFVLGRRARVLALDSDRPSIEALGIAARSVQGVKPIETRVRNLFTEPLSRRELDEVDAVVFDPPRAGAKAQAEALAKSKVPVVVAVSCNPTTLARDCRILTDGGYAIEAVTPMDQFLWSPHIEAVAVLRRGK